MRQEKIAILNEITSRLKDSDCTIVLSYEGLTVGELHELRKAVLPFEGRCLIAKNTLIGKAAKDLEWEDISSLLTGPTAVVTGKGDVSELAKAVVKFVNGHSKSSVKGAALDSRLLDAGAVKALSELPSKDVMRATLLATFMAPPTSLVRVFIAPLQGALQVLQAKATKDGEEA